MGSKVTVSNPAHTGLQVTLNPGDELVFGRTQKGVGQISRHRAVSGTHGVIRATDDGFSVTSTGSMSGLIVADRTTPSRLVVARGVGPVTVPFADCSIIVEYQHGRDHLNIVVSGSAAADRWRHSWGPQMRERWAGVQQRRLTWPPWPMVGWRKSNGKPRAWFNTLIALCEPALSNAPAGTPTNEDIARRCHLSTAAIERHMTEIYNAFGMFDDDRDRELVIAIAIDQGIVTAADLG